MKKIKNFFFLYDIEINNNRKVNYEKVFIRSTCKLFTPLECFINSFLNKELQQEKFDIITFVS